MKWSTEVPKAPGQYWYRSNRQSRENFRNLGLTSYRWIPPMAETPIAVVLRVDGDLLVHFTVGSFTVDMLAGEWAGPIELPEEQ